MGMDLSGAGGYFRWTNSAWADILEIGQVHGWVPTGTGPPRGMRKAEWEDGNYFSNDGQLFCARDARTLADALERAVAAMSAGDAPPRTRPARATDYVEATIAGRRAPKKDRVAVRAFGPEDLAYIREFIEFCRAGSFRIN